MKISEKIMVTFLVLFIFAILVYAANEDPAEFGDDTITTAWLGGHKGLFNLTGNAFLGNYSVNISTTGDVNATKFYGDFIGDGSGISGIALGTGAYKIENFTANYNDLFVGWKLANFTTAFNAIYNLTDPAERQNLDDNITQLRADMWKLFNFTEAFNNIYNISDSSILYNGSDASFKSTNVTNYYNGSGALDWITCANVADLDKECIESDLNTWVDIAGDTMTGDLIIGADGVDISTTGDMNISRDLNVTGNFSVNTPTHDFFFNGSCWITRVGSTEGRICG